MKILIVSDAWLPQLNGVVRTYQYLIPELEQLDHSVKLVGPADFKWRTPAIHDVQLAFFTRQKLEILIKEYTPDRIHIAVEGPLGWTARKICIKNNLPFTTCFHTNFPVFVTKHLKGLFKIFEKPLYNFSFNILRNFHAPSSCIFTATQELTEKLKAHGFKGPFARMTRGADNRYFYVGEKNLFHDLPKPVAIYVGRVSKEKNIDAFLSAHWEGSKVVVGDGPDLDRLKHQFPDARFLGRKEGRELGDHLRSADIFAFPSLFDTFGIVMIEALSCGLPVAAFYADGANSIITEDLLGARDTDFSTAMTKALSAPGTPEMRADMVKKHYSWGKTAKQFLAACGGYG